MGTHDFQWVTHPQTRGLVVWSGHVGIVVNPAQHVFFSTLRQGPGIDKYAQYWENGQGLSGFTATLKALSPRCREAGIIVSEIPILRLPTCLPYTQV